MEDLAVGGGQVPGGELGLRMRREDDGVAGLEGEHGVAHRRHDRVGDGADGGDDAHRLGDEDEVGVFVLADDPARLLAFETVPDDPGLALGLGHLVFVHPEAGLFMRAGGDGLGVVVDVFAEVADDGVDLLLGELLIECLGDARLVDEVVDHARRGRGVFLETAADGEFSSCTYHVVFPIVSYFWAGFRSGEPVWPEKVN